MHSGKLNPEKRTAELVRAFKNIDSNNSFLFIFGMVEEPYKDEIMHLIQNDKRVYFLGWKKGEEINELLCAADVYCQPGSPSATSQLALCCGCTEIVYPSLSYKALYGDSVLYAENEKALLEQLKKLEDKAVLHISKEKAFLKASSILDYKKIAERYLRDGKFPGKKKSKIYDFWQTTISKWRSTPLFSLSYFQSSLPFVLDREGSRLLDVEAHPEKLYYEPDGSRHQTEHMQNASIEDVKKEVQSLDYTVFDCTLETKRKEEFEQLLDYLEKQGVTVEFWICPLSPSLWSSLNKQKYPIFEELEGYANLVARRKKIHISGSFNPDTVGVSDADFYDARHMKRKSIARFFTF